MENNGTEKLTEQVTEQTTEKKKKRKKRKVNKKLIAVLIVIEVLVLIEVIHLLSMNISLNSDDVIQYAGTEYEDTISYDNGKLKVNNVSVKVPHNDSVTYNIAYSWGKEDTDYPTIPHSITAMYKNEDGTPMYDITLYRDDFIPAKEIPKGKDAENWFADWETVDNEDNKQFPLDTEKVHGFMINAIESDGSEGPESTYETSTYYFATQADEGLSVYIIEGILYDKENLEEFQKVMDDSTKSISIPKKSKNKKKKN